MSYKVIFKQSAERSLARLPDRFRKRLLTKIEGLETNPRPVSARKLTAGDRLWRIRSGDYRAIYTEPEEGVIYVVKIGRRSVVYRSIQS